MLATASTQAMVCVDATLESRHVPKADFAEPSAGHRRCSLFLAMLPRRCTGTAAVCTLITILAALSAVVSFSGRGNNHAHSQHVATIQHQQPAALDERALNSVVGANESAATVPSSGISAQTVAQFFSSGGKINAFVFAGRRRYLRILWPYLLRDKRNGTQGVLHQVLFVANTDDADDLDWLSTVEEQYPNFVEVIHRARVVHQGQNNYEYCSIFAGLKADLLGSDRRPGSTLLLKLDDDIVYIAPGALEKLAAAKLEHPQALFVSGNVVNHPLLAHVHQRTMLLSQTDVDAMVQAEIDVQNKDFLPDKWQFGYGTFNHENWGSWQHALLQHMLLVHRIRTLGHNETSSAYNAFRVWDFDSVGYGTGRWSINAFAFWPDIDLDSFDVDVCRKTDDEEYITNVLPGVVGRHCIATGDALFSHFAYYPQREGLETTHMLARYQALAEEVARK